MTGGSPRLNGRSTPLSRTVFIGSTPNSELPTGDDGFPPDREALFAYQMTDETFALHANRFAKDETGAAETFGINVIAQSAWVGGTVLGLAASTLITDIRPIGLDYALPAMFIALLLGQLKSRQHLAVAVIAGVLSTILMLAGLQQSHVLAATIIAATIGLGVHAWTSKRSS